MPGLKKRRILYNGDQAKNYQIGVLVEGVTDAWRVGPRAVALLGKSVSSFQRDLLCAYFHGGTLIIMLDPDAIEDIDRVHKQLHPEQFKGTCKVVKLPDDTDPGESTTEFLYEQIRIQAGVEVK
jgi:DNA primase